MRKFALIFRKLFVAFSAKIDFSETSTKNAKFQEKKIPRITKVEAVTKFC